MNRFKYELGGSVTLIETTESGTVIGRGEFLHSENTYLVRYQAADGRQTEAWWGESALVAQSATATA